MSCFRLSVLPFGSMGRVKLSLLVSGVAVAIVAVVFGALVGLIATHRGFHSAPSSAGVSAATTGTVVTASVTILVFDLFMTAIWGV